MTRRDNLDNHDRGTTADGSALSRRRFLHTAAAGAAVAGTASLLSQGPLALAVGSAAPKRGGRLRVGMAGGGSAETLNPNQGVAEIDIARDHCLYERLFDYAPDGSLVKQLAADYSYNHDGSVWKLKVRPGVLFHDGATLTADDVVYSMKYWLAPANKAQAGTELPFLKPGNVRALDASTVQITLDAPNAILPTILSSRSMYIFKKGTTSFDRPNGTGPFKFKSWTRGERSLFVRFDGYRLHNGPYLDELELISINDPTTRLNALVAGQVDAIVAVDPKLVATVKANPALRILQHDSGQWPSQFMQVNRPPFNDNRVRLAFKYMVDRKAIIDTVLLGYGLLGNDLPCPFDPDYAHEIPQRPYDPERAKALLKQAGHDGLSVTLYTSDVYPGILDSSVVLAEQAKKAGVTITLNKVPSDQYWSTTYEKVPFEVTYWSQKPLTSQMAQGFESTATFNETHWNRPGFDKLVREARRTLDAKKRHELWVAAQRLIWQDSGYLIWGFYRLIDAYSAKVHGLVPSSARNLGWYTFTDVYLS